MNDDFLNQLRKPPREEFADRLYQRITQPMPKQSNHPVLRFIALSFSILALAAGVLFFSPPARAFADSLMRQIGGYIFVQGPLQSGPVDAKAAAEWQQAVRVPDKKDSQVEGKPAAGNPNQTAPDAAGASVLAGFEVLAPAYLPQGFTPAISIKDLSAGAWSVEPSNNGTVASINYSSQANQRDFLIIEEFKYVEGARKETYTRPEIEDVTVRGQTGIWLPMEGGKNSLVWEENGITYSLISTLSSREEMLKIAESLGK